MTFLSYPPKAFSLAIGAAAVAVGFTALSKHTGPGFARRYGLPNASAHYHFIGATGSRNVVIGLSILAFGFREDWRGVGTVMACSTFSGIVDTLITWRYGLREASFSHLLGTVVLGAGGWWLLSV